MYKDKMTPMERARAITRGEEIDRIQCNPNIANGSAKYTGFKIGDFNTDAKSLAKATIDTYKKLGYDSVRVFTDLFILAEAMGATMKYPEDNTVDLLKPAIDDIKDINKIKTINPYKDGRIPVQLEAMKRVVDEIGDEVPCATAIIGPFTNASFLIGAEKLTKMLIKDEESVFKLMDISLESCFRFIDAAIETGIGFSISEPMASCTVISPKHFKKFVKPYLEKVIEYLSLKNKKTAIHICGKTEGLWDDLSKMGFSGFSIDNVVSLKDCVDKIGSEIKIMGNIHPTTVMYSGTVNEVKVESLKCIKDGYKSPKGYLLMSGCSLPVETDIKNCEAMMDIVRELGWPITDEKIEKLIKKYI